MENFACVIESPIKPAKVKVYVPKQTPISNNFGGLEMNEHFPRLNAIEIESEQKRILNEMKAAKVSNENRNKAAKAKSKSCFPSGLEQAIDDDADAFMQSKHAPVLNATLDILNGNKEVGNPILSTEDMNRGIDIQNRLKARARKRVKQDRQNIDVTSRFLPRKSECECTHGCAENHSYPHCDRTLDRPGEYEMGVAVLEKRIGSVGMLASGSQQVDSSLLISNTNSEFGCNAVKDDTDNCNLVTEALCTLVEPRPASSVRDSRGSVERQWTRTPRVETSHRCKATRGDGKGNVKTTKLHQEVRLIPSPERLDNFHYEKGETTANFSQEPFVNLDENQEN